MFRLLSGLKKKEKIVNAVPSRDKQSYIVKANKTFGWKKVTRSPA